MALKFTSAAVDNGLRMSSGLIYWPVEVVIDAANISEAAFEVKKVSRMTMITCYHSLCSFEKPRNNCLKPSLFAVAGRSTKLYLREGGEDDSTHCGSKWLKPAKNKFTEVISQVFTNKFQPSHIVSVSGHHISFIFKICQTVAGITIMSRFHDFFFNLIFGGFFQIGPTVRLRLARRRAAHGAAVQWRRRTGVLTSFVLLVLDALKHRWKFQQKNHGWA